MGVNVGYRAPQQQGGDTGHVELSDKTDKTIAGAGKTDASIIGILNYFESSLSAANKTGNAKTNNSVGSGPPVEVRSAAATSVNDAAVDDSSSGDVTARPVGSNRSANRTTSATATQSGGNKFLSPGELVAFMRNMIDLSNIERKQAVGQNLLQLLQTNLALADTKSEAKTIVANSVVQSNELIMQGVAACVSGVISIASAMQSRNAGREGEQDAMETKTKLNSRADEAAGEETAASKRYDAAKTESNAAKDDYESKANDPTVSDRDKTAAQNRAHQTKMKEIQEEGNFNKASERSRAAARERDNFDPNKHAMDYQQAASQFSTQMTQALGQFVQALSDFVQAGMKLQEGVLQAQQKIYETNIQLALKGIDNAAASQKDMHEAMAAIFQAIQKLEDDTRRLGGTISTAQAT